MNIFLLVITLFCFLTGHDWFFLVGWVFLFIYFLTKFFKIRAYESIYINYIFYPLTFLLNQTKKFSITPLFHPPNHTQMRKNKIFSIFPIFHPLPIFYPPTFPSSQPNGPLEFKSPFLNYRFIKKHFISIANELAPPPSLAKAGWRLCKIYISVSDCGSKLIKKVLLGDHNSIHCDNSWFNFVTNFHSLVFLNIVTLSFSQKNVHFWLS